MNNLEKYNVSELSMQELGVLQNQIVNAQMQSLTQELAEFKNAYERDKAIQEIEKNSIKDGIEDMADKLESVEKIAVTSNRVRNPRYGYVNQGDFGAMFNVSISSVRVGKLLKIVGIAQKSKRKTIPYRKFIPSLAKTIASQHYTSFQWNYTGCVDHIDKWLKKEGYHTDFYSIETESDMNEFIDHLYTIHGQE